MKHTYNILTRLTVQRNQRFGWLQNMKANFGSNYLTEGEKCNDPTDNVNCRLYVADRKKPIFVAMEEVPKATSTCSFYYQFHAKLKALLK